MTALIVLIGTFLMVSLIGLLIYAAMANSSFDADTVVGGAAFGFCFVLLLAYISIYLQGSYMLASAAFLAAGLTAALVLWRRKNFKIEPLPAGLVLTLGLVFATRFGAAARHDFPLGWDPAFHLLLAKKILSTKSLIADWLPFRDIALNYPIGTHNLLVWFQSVTGIQLELVFNAFIPFLGVLNTGQIFCLVRRATSRIDFAIYGAFAYGMFALFGSIDYYRWGGLPNQLGMTFMLATLQLLARSKLNYGEVIIAALLLASIPLTHHHVMISMGVILSIYAIMLAREKRWLEIVQVANVGLIATIIVSPVLWRYFSRVHSVGQTSILDFSEDISDPFLIPASLGYVFFAFSLYGFWAMKRRGARFPSQTGFTAIGAGLFALFLLLGYVTPVMTQFILGRQVSPFTPSRFLTDAVYFLSIPAGVGIGLLREKTKINTKRFAILLLFLACTNLDQWRELYKRVPIAPELAAAYRYIEQAPQNVVLCDQDRRWGPHGSWATYLSWHRTGRTPVPISEPQASASMLESEIDRACQGDETSRSQLKVAGLEIWDVVRTEDIPEGNKPINVDQRKVAIIRR